MNLLDAVRTTYRRLFWRKLDAEVERRVKGALADLAPKVAEMEAMLKAKSSFYEAAANDGRRMLWALGVTYGTMRANKIDLDSFDPAHDGVTIQKDEQRKQLVLTATRSGLIVPRSGPKAIERAAGR